MKEYQSEKIRNICLSGHNSSGKTTLTEAILYATRTIERMGRVEDGGTASDYDPEEISRRVSINATINPFEYKDLKVNLIDLPGYRDFVAEVKGPVRVSDTMIILMDATSGAEVGAEFACEYSDEYKLPRLFFINKMDKERANFKKALEAIKSDLGLRPVAVTIPVGQEASFEGVIDLLRMKMIKEEDGKQVMLPIPDSMKAEADDAYAHMMEIAAEGNDDLTMKYLEELNLTPEEVLQGLKEGFAQQRFCPVFCGAASKAFGVHALLNFIVQCCPSPLEMPAWIVKKPGSEEEMELPFDPAKPTAVFVFKTITDPYAGKLSFVKIITGSLKSESSVYNANKQKEERLQHVYIIRGKKLQSVHQLHAGDIGVLSKLDVTATNDALCDSAAPVIFEPTILPSRTTQMAIKVPTKSEEEKIGLAIHRLMEQDESLSIHRDPEIKQTILMGMGETHLDVAISRLKALSGVQAHLVEPRVPYRETITKKAEGSYRHKKQSGGRGQFGEVWLKLEPIQNPEDPEKDYEFSWDVVGGNIPTKFMPSVEKGIVDALQHGALSGNKVVNVRVSCFDGKDHPVDSSDMAFKLAASMGFKEISLKAGPIILEPIYKLRVTVPENYMGDVMGNLSGKRGKILGNANKGKKVIIEALVPQAEVFSYSRDLRSLTQGRGVFEMEYSHYEAAPPNLQEKIIEEAKKLKEEENE